MLVVIACHAMSFYAQLWMFASLSLSLRQWHGKLGKKNGIEKRERERERLK